ncbi:hypothetical protein AB0B10_25805 [Micromonospora arborensis]|uniref:hypothetical protein n=1 Tax=Micromonospora arborensis TaxID=2116518 RepID=UPI0033E85DCC
MQRTLTAGEAVEPQPAPAPAVVFDRAAFQAITETRIQRGALGLLRMYDSHEDEASWLAHRALTELSRYPEVWRYAPGVEGVTIHETHDHEGHPDGGGVVAVTVDGIELCAGELDADELVPVKPENGDRVELPQEQAAELALAAIAEAVNRAAADFRAVTASTPAHRPLRAIRRILLDAADFADAGLWDLVCELLADAGVWTDADDAAATQRRPADRTRGRVLAEVLAEMNRTDEHVAAPTVDDYRAALIRLLTVHASPGGAGRPVVSEHPGTSR